jgi:hypothetical protein
MARIIKHRKVILYNTYARIPWFVEWEIIGIKVASSEASWLKIVVTFIYEPTINGPLTTSGKWKVMLFIINEIDSWFSKGFKSEIFALASGDGELKMTFNNLMLELSKEAENRTLRQNLYGFAADVVRNLLYS